MKTMVPFSKAWFPLYKYMRKTYYFRVKNSIK